MTRLEKISGEESSPIDPNQLRDLKLQKEAQEHIPPTITQQKGHRIVDETLSEKHSSILENIKNLFLGAIRFLIKPFTSEKKITAKQIDTQTTLQNNEPKSKNIFETQAKEFVNVLNEIKAAQAKAEVLKEKSSMAPKELSQPPAKLELPDDFEEVMALANQASKPIAEEQKLYEETIPENIEAMQILKEIQDEKLRPMLQEKFEAAYQQVRESSIAMKAISPFDPNFETVQKMIQQRATTLLREIKDLTAKQEVMQLPVVKVLERLSGEESKTTLNPQSAKLLSSLLKELSASGGGIKNFELAKAIAHTSTEDLTKIWAEYAVTALTADTPQVVPLSTMGLAFQNINSQFKFDEIVEANPFIKHSLKAEQDYKETYVNKLAQLAKLDQSIKASRTSLLNVIENSAKIFNLDPSLVKSFKDVLMKAEDIYLQGGSTDARKTQLESTRSEFMRLHKQWLDAVKGKMDGMSETEKLKTKEAIKKAIPEYNTKMYQSGQFDSLIAIISQWQMPAFTDTVFDTIKNAFTAQTKLAETDPNAGLEAFDLS